MSKNPEELKAEILRLTREYSALMHKGQRPAGLAAQMLNDRCSSSGLGEQPDNPTTLSSADGKLLSDGCSVAGFGNNSTAQQSTTSGWQPGQTIPYAGRVFDQDEVEAAVGATLDFWLTLGPEGEAFEKELAALLGVKHSLLVNSGSSANLVAFATFTTHKLPEHKRIRHGDEVITVAAGFPTTVTPIIQLGAVPVFIDNDPATGNIRADQLESAYVAGKTKAVMIAHALGNPFDLGAVLEFCRKYDLWLIEDNCDALGCTYSLPLTRAKALGLDHLIKLAEANSVQVTSSSSGLNPSTGESVLGASSGSENTGTGTGNLNCKVPYIRSGVLTAYTGTFGDISTQSFYPPHHLTMGEGGAVNIISRPPLKTYAESFRDWGRDCWCASGKDDTCGKRFGWQLGELPKGYDHKYIYSHLGYNLKPLDPQAAIGRQQLKKLPAFIEARRQNWETLRVGLADLEDVLDFTLPTHAVRWIPPAERVGSPLAGASGKLLNDKCSLFGSGKQPATGADAPSQLLSDECSLPVSGNNPSTINPATGEIMDFASCFVWDSTGCQTDASWFGFMMRVKPTAPFSHTDLARHLDANKIGNRMFFGGNLLRQPVFVQLKKDRPDSFRVVSAAKAAQLSNDGSLLSGSEPNNSQSTTNNGEQSPHPGADEIMHGAIFLGTYPGLTAEMIAHEIAVIREFVASKRS